MLRLLQTGELQLQVVTPPINNTMSKEHAGTPSNGGYFHGRTTVHHHQGAGYQWPAAQNTSSHIYYTSTSQQNHFMQPRAPLPPHGLQVNCNQGNFYQDSRLINSHQPQSSLQKTKADCLQQNVPAQWKQQGANQRKLVPRSRMKDSQGRDTGMTANPVLPSSPTTTSPPHQQWVDTGQCESSRTHYNQVIYSQCIRENNTQQATGYYHRPPSYSTQSQQPSRDGHYENMPVQHVSYMGQRSQQHPAQRSPTFHSKEAVTQRDKQKTISRIIHSLKSSWPVNQDVCATASNSSQYTGVQPSITTQPMPTSTSNTRQSSVFIPGEISEYIPFISPTQDVAASSQRTPYVPCNVVNVLMIDQNMSLGKEVRNSRSPEALPSTTEEDCAVNSPPGYTNSKAIAVVLPLSQQSCQVSSGYQAFDAVGSKCAAAASCESPKEVSEKPERAQELSSRLAGKMLADHDDAQMSPPSDEPRSQSCESGDDPEASMSKTSSAPTITWTIKELQKLIETEETAQQSCDLLVDGRRKVRQLFTKGLGSPKARKGLLYAIKESNRFVKEHVMADTELVQLKQGVENQQDPIPSVNALYTEPAYRSTWLNINKQLDDIDKEFGFPPCLRFPHIQKTDGQTDLVTAASVTPEQAGSQVSEKDLEQEEPKLVESDVEKQVESSPIEAASPDDTPDGDSPDSWYSFKIHVLPPEEAKLIYERTERPEQHCQVARVENQDSDHQPEKDSCSSVEGDVSNLSVALGKEPDRPIDVICCLSRLVGNIFKSNPHSVKCQCNDKESDKDVIDITDSDSDDSVIEMVAISSKSPCEVVILAANKSDNPSSSNDASSSPHIVDVYVCAGSESIQAVVSDARDGEIENPSDGDGEKANLLLEGEDEKLSVVSSDSSAETEEQTTPDSPKTAPLPDVRQTGKSEKESKPQSKAVSPLSLSHSTNGKWQLSTRPEVSVDPPVRKHSGSNSKAAQLVLFGSVQQGPGKNCKRKRHFSSMGAVCTSSSPPEVLSVSLRSTKRQSSDPHPVQEQSVKNKLFDIWRKSFPVKSLKQKGKNMQRSPLSLRPQEKQPVPPEKKLELLNPSLRPRDGSRSRMETKCTSPGDEGYFLKVLYIKVRWRLVLENV